MVDKLIGAIASPTGSVYKDDANWNTCRSAATGESTQNGVGNQELVNCQFDVGAGNIYKIRRAFFQFIIADIIPLGATVKSAKFIIKRDSSSVVTNTNNSSLYVTESTQPDSAAIAVAHYNDVSINGYSNKAYSAIPNGAADIEMALNSVGIADLQAAVSAGGIFKLLCRDERDLTSNPPTGKNNITNCNLDSCQLEVIYRVPGGAIMLAIL